MARRTAFAMVALTMLAAPAAAQRAGTFEAGLITRGTLLDPSFKSLGMVGFGARIGAHLGPQWMLEADVSTSSSRGLDYQPVHIRAMLLQEIQPGGFMTLGLGYARNHFSGTVNGNDNGVAGLFGFRQVVRERFFTRVELSVDYIPSPANGAGDNWNGTIQVGGGYRFSRQ